MPVKPITEDRTKTKYFIHATYKLWAREKFSSATRYSLEECHKWLEEHKTLRVETGVGSWHNAILKCYRIYKIVETRTTVEKGVVELDK